MKTLTYPIYSLANPHLSDVELFTNNGDSMKGEFVEFKVVKDFVEYLYPSEKYCFLPIEKRKTFWDDYKTNKGNFKTFPAYIKLLGLNDIKKIIIEPKLIV